MALPMFNNYTDPGEEDPRKTRKNLQQSAVSSMSSPTQNKPATDTPTQRTQSQQEAIQRRMKRRNLSEDPYQNKPQG
jgi:hypothetical protein